MKALIIIVLTFLSVIRWEAVFKDKSTTNQSQDLVFLTVTPSLLLTHHLLPRLYKLAIYYLSIIHK
ncbi:DUF3624 family protein [Bacillus cereus]